MTLKKYAFEISYVGFTLVAVIIISSIWLSVYSANGNLTSQTCVVINSSVQNQNGYYDICLRDNCQNVLYFAGWSYTPQSLQCYLDSKYPVNSTIECYEYSKSKKLFLARPDAIYIILITLTPITSLLVGGGFSFVIRCTKN